MSKALVAYFSASGVTAALAARLAKVAGADLFEIAPEVPYTAADLDWTDKKSRSTIEMNDPASRPAIGSRVADMGQYDVVFVGFPIWWYREPSIIDTFMEAYDFSGKTIVPFCTSGGSGVGRSDRELHKNVGGDVKWAKGRQINRPNESEIRRWMDEVL
jgi:flavodoxin